MFYAAEFNKNKNQQILIRGISFNKGEGAKCKTIIGWRRSTIRTLQTTFKKLGVEKMVDFLVIEMILNHY